MATAHSKTKPVKIGITSNTIGRTSRLWQAIKGYELPSRRKTSLNELSRGFWWILFVCGLIAVGIAYMEWRLDGQLRYRVPASAEMVNHEAEPLELLSGQIHASYVPAYSHVYYQDGRAAPLTVTLSVRNINRNHEIALKSVRYYDSRGVVVRSLLDKPYGLKPLATVDFLIKRDDATGGGSPSFVVEWAADETATQPLIETIMVGTLGRQDVSFARRGFVLAGSQHDNEAESQ